MSRNMESSSFRTTLLCFLLVFKPSEAFFPARVSSTRQSIPSSFSGIANKRGTASIKTTTSLRYTNHTDAIEPTKLINIDSVSTQRRDELKEILAKCSIQNYDHEGYSNGETSIAEDIMKELEPLRPWSRPASHPGLNARFSFVFTGVPTIGMRLITLLSRISVGFPVVEFSDVFLEVFDQNTKAKAIVSFKLLGIPLELNVNTDLCADETCPDGTMMNEQFQGLTLQGVTIPTPESWHNSRTLEVSYLDDDMMIARTAGGEPHYLLRHSSCSTDDEACDIDSELTDYFEEAQEKFGDEIARCLVDREYGKKNECGDRSTNPLTTILSLEPGSLFGIPTKKD